MGSKQKKRKKLFRDDLCLSHVTSNRKDQNESYTNKLKFSEECTLGYFFAHLLAVPSTILKVYF